MPDARPLLLADNGHGVAAAVVKFVTSSWSHPRLSSRALRRWSAALILTLLSTLVASAPAAPADEVSPARQVLILTRALAYDGNLKTRAGGDLLIAVLGKAGYAPSDELAGSMSRAFRGLGNVKVQGLAVRATQVAYKDPASLAALIEREGIDALYVAPGLDAELMGIVEATRKLKVLSMASRQDYVQRGLSMGVFAIEGKPTIVVNLIASKAEGAAFGSDLLRLAKVIR
jgi:YfiR/HmsC-like